MADLHDKVVLITGAAGGIGSGAAQVLLQGGATVVAIDSNADKLAELQTRLDHDKLLVLTADLSNDDSHQGYVNSLLSRFSRLDGAVFNAGIEGINVPMEEYPVELFDRVMAINMRAVWLGMRAVIPAMKKQNKGSIVLTSSVQGLAALGGTTAYTTSKHALVGMMKGASQELAPFNIRVNAVHPGYVDTDMMDRIHHSAAPDGEDSFARMLAGTVPMQRYARPQEIGQLMAFLLSDDSSYSTGSSFIADGGVLASL